MTCVWARASFRIWRGPLRRELTVMIEQPYFAHDNRMRPIARIKLC